MITDRDIAVRGVARGRGADTRVSDLMTHDVECCKIDADVSEVERVMTERQVRRVPIIDADGELVGIVSQADLATSGQVDEEECRIVIERISAPDAASRPAQGD
jgi:CBS domain-containing protein